MKRFGIFAAIVLMGLVASAKTASERIDSLMSLRYDDPLAPGAAVIVVKGDSIIAEHYYGVADVETKQPVTATTTFNIASISKQFTVIGALTLQQKGMLDIDTSVRVFYPEFKASFWENVTLRHLASQSSGIPDSRDRSSRQKMIYATDSSSMSYFPLVTGLKFNPGECYDYINPTFLLIAGAMEKVTGQKFVDYQQKAIFDVCQMKDTYYFNPSDTVACQSHGYVPSVANGWSEKDYGEETFFATRPDGGIYSTARDMIKWEKALANGSVLCDSLIKMAYTPVVSVSESVWCDYQRRPNTFYAMGWFVDKTPGYPVKVYHTGDNGGYQAYLAKFPSADVAVVVLENRNDKDRWYMAKEIDRILKEENFF